MSSTLDFDYRGWRILIELDRATSGETVSAHARLHDHGTYHCRLVLASPHHDGAGAVAALADKARALIDSRCDALPTKC